MPVNADQRCFARIAVALCAAIGLSACSMKPGESDISRSFGDQSLCEGWEVVKLEKTNGAEAGENLYDVAFRVTAQVKGGPAGAMAQYGSIQRAGRDIAETKRHLDLLAVQRKSAEMAGRQEEANRIDEEMEAVREKRDEFERGKMRPFNVCGSQYAAELISQHGDALAHGPGPIKVAYGAVVEMAGRMQKREAGWQFIQHPTAKRVDLLLSEPMEYVGLEPSYKFQAPQAENAGAVAAVATPEPASPSSSQVAPPAGALALPSAAAAKPGEAATPSFDCAKASTKVEKLICSESQLAQADAATTAAFKAALAKTPDAAALRSQHAQWRKTVRDACQDASCVAAAYKGRLAELSR